jgi:hypothetical protein
MIGAVVTLMRSPRGDDGDDNKSRMAATVSIAREQAPHTPNAGRSSRGPRRSQHLGEEAPRWASRGEAEK